MKRRKPAAPKDPLRKEYSTLQNMVYIMKGTFRYQKPLLFFFPAAILMSVINSYLPTFALSAIIDRVTAECTPSQLLLTVAAFFGVLLLVMALQTFADANIGWRMYHARIKIMMRRIRKVLFMDYEHLESSKVMEACQRAMRATGGETNGVEGMMRSFQSLMVTLVSVATAVGIVWQLSPWMVLLMVFLGMCSYFNMDWAKRNDKLTWDEMAPYWRKTWYMMQTMTNFTYGKDVRLFSMKDWLLGKYRDLNQHLHAGMRRSYSNWMRCAALNQLMYLAEEAGLYGYLIYCVLTTDMSIAEFTLYLGAVRTFFAVLQSVFNTVTDMKNQSREINDFRTFLEYPERERNKGGAALPLSADGKYRFVFENVSFRYPNTEGYALKNLNLTLEVGERLAVVGMNGAGKSTFIKLLCGLYTPTEGRILLNGVDIRSYDKRAYFELFAPVFQNVELFAFPMDENVSMKMPEDTDSARAEDCLRDAGLGAKLNSLPKGVKTELLKVISEEGIDLSGGEKQKLAFARALYKDAPIVILDEPTAALDALAEYDMYQSFDRLVAGRSAVYISHRLSSTRFCDHVAVFIDGELREYGTHDSLLAADGEYSRMFEVQAQYYQEGGSGHAQS